MADEMSGKRPQNCGLIGTRSCIEKVSQAPRVLVGTLELERLVPSILSVWVRKTLSCI